MIEEEIIEVCTCPICRTTEVKVQIYCIYCDTPVEGGELHYKECCRAVGE